MRKHLKTAVQRYGWMKISVAALIVLNLALAFYLVSSKGGSVRGAALPEDLTGMSFKDLSGYFTEIAEEDGAIQAFSVLRNAILPPNVDVHLLAHVIGDILYKQQGAQAITLCTDEFRNACSHTIVIGTLLEKGPESFGEIADLCRQAPGGSGAYTMCFHGLGHGVLAFNEYELPLAVEMCKKSGDPSKGREFAECVGGTIMEMIAGVHDRAVWEEKSKKYFKKEDPLYPCTAGFMPDSAKGMCFTYITPHLFESAGANLAMPEPEHFKKAFEFCDAAPEAFKPECFGGFGKEFIVLAQARDVRAIGSMSDDKLELVHDWCALSKTIDGRASCISSALNSMYWGGENDPDASIRFCVISERRGDGGFCFENLVGAVDYYAKDPSYRSDLCDRFPENHKAACRERLL